MNPNAPTTIARIMGMPIVTNNIAPTIAQNIN